MNAKTADFKGYYFLFGNMYVIAGVPGALEKCLEHPFWPVATLEELKAIVTQEEADQLYLRRLTK